MYTPFYSVFRDSAEIITIGSHHATAPNRKAVARRAVPILLAFLISPFTTALAAGQPDSRPHLIVVEAPVVRLGGLAQRFPKGSQLVNSGANSSSRTLTSGFFAAADPRVSFDSSHVLFSGKQAASSTWQIWEMNLDGSGARQITHCVGDCIKPAYLPRGELVFTAFSSERGRESQIWVSKLDGSDPHPITFGPGNYQVETVLANGMVLATADSPLVPSRGVVADRQLYTVRPDGTGLATLRCDHQHPAIRTQASELDNGAVVFVKAPAGNSNLGGELAWIRRGALHNSPLINPASPAVSPQPLGGNELLIARRSNPSAAGESRFALYAVDAEAGKLGVRVFGDPKLSAVEAVPVAVHEPPRWYWSTLNPALKRGYFICLDASQAQGFPRGRIPAKLARVRVLTLDSNGYSEKALGEAPIEADGSFYIAVPQDRPVRFELLDQAGRVVRKQRSWLWARSGEEHGCVGCHEDRAVAPENRWPLALRSFSAPTRLDAAGQPVSAH